MRCLPIACSLLLLGCSQGGLPGGEEPPADLTSTADPDLGSGPDLGGGPDLVPAADLALPPAEGKPLWGRSYAQASVKDVAVAPDGSIYMTGSFYRADLGEGQVSSSGNSDVFLIKHDKVGQRLWTRTFGRSYSDVPDRLAVDKDGNAAVVGYSLRSGDTGTHDAFVAVYGPTGTQRFFRSYGGPKPNAVDTARAVAFAADGGLWVAGGFEDRIDFGGGELISAGDRDLYLLRLSSSGAHILSKRYGFTGYDQASGVAVLPDGDVVLTGSGGYPIDFGDGNVGTDPMVDSYLVRLAPDGKARWSKRYRLRPYSGRNVTTGPGGTVWLYGDQNGTVDYGGGPRTPATGRGVFWAQYAGDGAHLSSFVLPSNSGIYLNHAVIDESGQIVSGGRAEGDVDFGAGNTTAAAGRAFFFKSTADGRVRWAHRFGGDGSDDESLGVGLLPGGQIVVGANPSKASTLGAATVGPGASIITVTY